MMRLLHRRPGALLPVGVLLVGLLLTGTAPAHADTASDEDPSTGVGITPARVEVDLGGRVFDFDITVFNDTARPRDINMALLELGHDLDGTPVLGEVLSELAIVDGGSSFTLAPGESNDLALRAEFPESVALYGAVVAQVEPDTEDRAVGIRTQVASIVLLRGPRPWDQTLQQRDIGILEGGEGGSIVFADIANIGNAHVRSSTMVRVRKGGEIVAEVELPAEAILPGYARRLTAPLGVDDLDGSVEIELDLGDGFGPSTTVDLDDLPSSAGTTDPRNGGSGGATLEQPSEPGTSVDNQRRMLLPLAAILILLAIAALYLMLLWKREEDEEDEEEDEPIAARAASAAGEDEGS